MAAARTSSDAWEELILAWTNGGVDAVFLGMRDSGPNQNNQVLFEERAKPATPRPYCVYTQQAGRVMERMSFEGTKNKEIRVARYTLTVYAKTKADCRTLTRKISDTLQGGAIPNLLNGCVLRVLFVDDYSGREDEEEPSWTLIYDVIYDAETNE